MTLDATHPPTNTRRILIGWYGLLQLGIILFAANGPFVDEGIYGIAGVRLWQGHLEDVPRLLELLNGSPFIQPIIVGPAYWLAGLNGARMVTLLFGLLTLWMVGKATESLFGSEVADWAVLALAANGLFAALAHFAVIDTPAIALLSLSLWLAARGAPASGRLSVALAGAVFGLAVLTKFAMLGLIVPLAIVAAHRKTMREAVVRVTLLATAAAALIIPYAVGTWQWLTYSVGVSYFAKQATFGVPRPLIAIHSLYYIVLPLALSVFGGIVAWRQHSRWLSLSLVGGLWLFPIFHFVSGVHVSQNKHVVAGFVLAYPLVGLALDKLWTTRRRWLWVVMPVVAVWGGLQWFWQEYSYPDIRPISEYLVERMKAGERILFGSTYVRDTYWAYALPLYLAGANETPWELEQLAEAPPSGLSVCDYDWYVGEAESGMPDGDAVFRAMRKCGYDPDLEVTGRKFYLSESGVMSAADFTIVASHAGEKSAWCAVEAPFLPHYEPQAALVAGDLYLFGGYSNTGKIHSSISRFDLGNNRWLYGGEMPLTLTHAAVAAVGDSVYLAGGHTGSYFEPSNVLWRYEPAASQWHNDLPPLPRAASAGAMAAVGRRLHFIGGVAVAELGSLEDSALHWTLDLDNLSAGWQAAAPFARTRNHLGIAVVDGKIYAIGGQRLLDEHFGNLPQVDRYDPDTDSWQPLADLPYGLSHSLNSVAVVDGRIRVAGGLSAQQQYTNRYLEYDPAGDMWRELAIFPDEVESLALAVVNGRTFVVGGTKVGMRAWEDAAHCSIGVIVP